MTENAVSEGFVFENFVAEGSVSECFAAEGPVPARSVDERSAVNDSVTDYSAGVNA